MGLCGRLAHMTAIAEHGPTPLTSPAVPPQPMRHHNVRVDDATWKAALRIADLRGERISDVIREFLRGYVRRHRKLLEDDPE